MVEGAIYWYEEETVEDDYEEEYMESEVDFTEVTYESECPTEDDILLGTLPPAPPLAEHRDLKKINDASEQRLLDAMRKKRDELPTKTTVPGTQRNEKPLPNNSKPKRVASSKQGRASAPPLEHHHSPTGVWEDLHTQESQEAEKQVALLVEISPRPRIKATPRVKKIDEIILRHDERRAFALPSAVPGLQLASLEKFWRKRIDHQVAFLEQQLHSTEREMMKIESDLARIQKSKNSA